MEKKQTLSVMKHYVLIRKYLFYSMIGPICSYTCFRMYIKLFHNHTKKYFFVIKYHKENATPTYNV